MMAADWGEKEPAPPSGDQDTPDWTTWLRSRLERVSNAERKGPPVVGEPGEAAGDDEPQGDDADPGPAPTPIIPAPPTPPTAPESPPPTSEPPTAPEQPSRTSEPPLPPRAPERPTWAPESPPAPAPVELEGLRAAVSSLVAGVGTLADTFNGFRGVVTERLDEYAKTVLRVTNDAAVGVEEDRKAHSGTIDELRRTVAEVSDRLQRLAGGMDDLATRRGDDERWAEVMGRLLDDVDAERQAAQVQERAVEGVAERLGGLELALPRLTADVAEVVAGQRRVSVDIEEVAAGQHRIAVDLAEVVAGQHRAAVDLAEVVAGQHRLAADVAEVVAGHQGVNADLADVVAGQHRLAADVAEVVAGQQGVAADVAEMAEGQRSSAGQDRPLRLDDAQVLEFAEVVAAAATSAPQPPPPPSPPSAGRSSAPPRGPRTAPLRAQRKATPPRPRR